MLRICQFTDWHRFVTCCVTVMLQSKVTPKLQTVADGKNYSVIKLERKIIETALVVRRRRDEKLCLVWVKFEFVLNHPLSDIMNTSNKFEKCTCRISRNSRVYKSVNLYIISVNMVIEVMLTENVSSNMGIKHKAQWANDRTLWKAILEFNDIREFSSNRHTA